MSRSVRGWLIVAGFAAFGALAANILLMTVAPYLISKAALVTGFADVAVVVTAVRAFAIARAALRYSERHLTHLAALRLLTRIRVDVFRGVERVAPGGLPHRSGDVLARLDTDVRSLDDYFMRGLIPASAAALAGAIACVIVGTLEVRLGLLLAGMLLVTGLGLPLGSRAASRDAAARLTEARGRHHPDLADDVQGVADLVAFGHAEAAESRVARSSGSLADLRLRLGRVNAVASSFGLALAGSTGLLLLAAAIPMVQTGHVGGLFLAAVPLVAFAAFEGILPLGDAFRQVEVSRAAAVRTFELTDAPPPVDDPPDPLPGPTHPPIVFDDVTFGYVVDQPPVLRDLSFTVDAGDRLGIVGPSGVGKTTVVNLLLRFWAPSAGRILLGTDDVRRFRADDVRALIGVVPQDPYLFNGTLRDNLLLADGHADDDRISDACERAQLTETIGALPRGLDTLVGENGHALSGGERQRVAIARLFLKAAPIAVLDEATANLDPATERRALAELDRFANDRTLVVVSHRAGAIALVDDVIRLERGPHASADS
jgi:ATP-binding cassette subfamily C protein CydC